MDTHPGEKIIFEGHPSWRSILSFYIKGLLFVAVAAGVAALASVVAEDEVKAGWVALAVLAGAGFMVIVGLLKRIATTYTITDQRLHIRNGIIARHVQETRLERVQNVNTNQSALERVLRVGTVDFDTAGSEDYEFAFKGVASPEKVVRAVGEATRRHDASLGDRDPDAGGEAAGPPPVV